MDTAYQKFETLFTAVEKEEQKQACCFTPDRGVYMGLNLMDLKKKKKIRQRLTVVPQHLQ